MIIVFEAPLPGGQIYPCSREDIWQQLNTLPEQDLEGLSAVGLVPSTRKDNDAYGRYLRAGEPKISLFSYPETLTFKLAPNTKHKDILYRLHVELEYGMQVEQVVSRWFCRWTAEDLRRFMIDHVLLHEIGHHVHYQQRSKQGYDYLPGTRAAEQFAEDYAIRQAGALNRSRQNDDHH